jgi:transposase
MAKTPIAGLLRIGWDTVGRIVERVMADHLDERRLDGLVAIGVDEISYRRGQRYLTSVADHASGAIVWCAPGRNSATLQDFFAELGERRHSIRAVSIDMSGEYQRAIRDAIPHAEICFDPWHVCRLAGRATDHVRREEWNAHERSHTQTGRWVKGTRWSLLKAPERQTVGQLATLREVQRANARLYRAFLLGEELRLLYHLEDPALAPAHLDAWLAWAARSRLRPFVALARTLRAHRTASSPRSASGSPTAASRASTARSA